MTAFQACVGQMYIVRTRAEFKADRTIEKRTLILQARCRDEIEPKLRHYLDLSVFANWRIVRIDKVKEHVHTLSAFLIPLDPMLPESFHVGDVAVIAPEPEQPSEREKQFSYRTFNFNLTGRVGGPARDFVLRRVGSWLLRLGLGEEIKPPFYGEGWGSFSCEPEAEEVPVEHEGEA